MPHFVTSFLLLILLVAAIDHRASFFVSAESPFVTGEDASAILQAAFAQAGVDLGPPGPSDDQQSSSSQPAQSFAPRPTLGERLRSTLRFVRRPSLLLRRHRLFQPHQLFIPILAPPTPLPQMQLGNQGVGVAVGGGGNLMKQNHLPKPHPIMIHLQQPSDRKSSNGIAVETPRQSPRSPIPVARSPPFIPLNPTKASSKHGGKSFKIVSSSGTISIGPKGSSSKSKETWIPSNHMSVGAATMNGFKPILSGGYSTNLPVSASGGSSDSLNSSSSSISPSLLETNEWKQITSPVTSTASDQATSSSNSKISVNSSKNSSNSITNSKIIATSDSGSEFRKVNNQVESNEVDRSVAESSINELTKFATLPMTPGEILAEVSKVIAASASVSSAARASIKGKSECTHKNLGWCEYSPESYPEAFVTAVVKECRDTIDRMYVEVPQNLAQFDAFVPFSPAPTHQTPFARINSTSSPPPPSSSTTNSSAPRGGSQPSWSWAGYKQSLTLCDSSRKFIRPSVAQDITGRWFVIVQSNLYHQTIPVELCKSPGSVCNGLGECGLNARCVQRHSQQLLISIDLDKEHDCPSMRLYRFPSGCACDHATYY